MLVVNILRESRHITGSILILKFIYVIKIKSTSTLIALSYKMTNTSAFGFVFFHVDCCVLESLKHDC